MPHTYATVADANDGIKGGDGSSLTTGGTAKLAVLEAVSRRIEAACHRSRFGSGFGPRIGTNLYDGDGANELLLGDDLQSISAFTVAAATTGTGVSPVVSTDYFLANPGGNYSGPPWRKVILHRFGSPTYFGAGYRTISITGTWGHSNVTAPTGLTVASGLAADATATSFTASAAGISPGMTLLIGTEHLYVSAVGATPFTAITVVRGANGSTAAVHADASTIARYVYDSRVRETAIRLFLRRWKARDAGADGSEGALDTPGQQTREGEKLILERGLADLTLLGIY